MLEDSLLVVVAVERTNMSPTKIILQGENRILRRISGSKACGGYAYPHISIQSRDMVSIAMAATSGIGDTKMGRRVFCLVANRSKVGDPQRRQMARKTEGLRVHSPDATSPPPWRGCLRGRSFSLVCVWPPRWSKRRRKARTRAL